MMSPSEHPRASALEIDQDEILGLTLDTLSKYTLITCIANVGFSAMSVAVAWKHCDHALAIGWMVVVWGFGMLRWWLAFLMTRQRCCRSKRSWLNLYAFLSGIVGVFWGLGAWVLFAEEQLVTRAFYTFIVAGLASGAATINAVYRPAFLAYVSTSAGLLSIRLLSFDGELDQLLGSMCVCAVAVYVSVGLLNYRLFMESFELRVSNVKLISRLEEAHLALESTNASLELRVEERTNSLECEIQARYEAECQLRRSHRMEAVGRLTGGIAHDFNNVLTVILNCLDLVRVRDAEDEVMVSHAQNAASRGAALTQQLLAFSRKSSSLPEVVEFNDVLSNMIDSMLRPVLQGSISLELVRSEVPVYVQVQRSDLDTAVLNLVLNARDAMPKGGIVSLILRGHGREVTLEVKDQGAGIDPHDLERVFEPSFSTKGKQGTGLGLSMVRGFALRSSGDIRAESSASGTSFYLTLPTCQKPTSSPVVKSRSRLAKAPRRATVLVVEDNPDLLRSTSKVVQDLGYRIECARDAEEALELLTREAIDILLSDIRMPGAYSGLDLACMVTERWPRVQILLVTGHAPELCGSDEFRVMRKPYSVRQLAQALHEAASEPWPPPGADCLAPTTQPILSIVR